MSDVVIEILDVTKRFGDFTAVDGVSLGVKKGEIIGLLGPNGAGKSTLTNMVCGLLTPNSGTIRISGLDVFKERNQAKLLLGSVPQDIILHEYLTAIENLKFFGVMNGLVGSALKKRIDEMIEYMGLDEDALRRNIKTLSGGMKRRVNIACGILHGPEIILLDEPTSGLDPQNRFELWQLIRKMNEEGKTIVLTTHLMDEAQELCNRVAIIDRGRIVALDTPRALMDSIKVQDAVLITLQDPTPDHGMLFESVDGVEKILQEEDPETHELIFRLLVDNAEGALPGIVRSTIDAKIKIKTIEVATPTLADVFLELTGRTISEAEQATLMEGAD